MKWLVLTALAIVIAGVAFVWFVAVSCPNCH